MSKLKRVYSDELTEDTLFDLCYEEPNHILLVVDRRTDKDNVIRKMLSAQKGIRPIEVECHEGHMKGKYRVVPVGYVTDLTKKYGIAKKRSEVDNRIFKIWCDAGLNRNNIKSPSTSTTFKTYLNILGIYKADYVVFMLEYSFL